MDEARFYRARKTLCAMLRMRGFDVPQELLLETEASFKVLFAAAPLPDIFATRQSDGERIGVGFAADDGNSVRVLLVRQFATRLKEEAISRGILVLANKLTPFAAREVRELPNKLQPADEDDDDLDAVGEPRIECFTLAKLHTNIMEYELQPKFEVLSAARVKKEKLDPSTLWHMLSTDPVALFLGLDAGQVVRITRQHPASGFEVVHRVVTDDSIRE